MNFASVNLLKKLASMSLIAIFLFFSIGLFFETHASFGTSPPWIRNNNMLPGTSFEQVINLSRLDVDQDMQIKVRYEGDKRLEKWLTIENEGNLIMKKGQFRFPLKARIDVPEDAPIQTYRGGIFLILEPMEVEQTGNVGINLGAHVIVEVNVIGDRVVDYQIKSVNLDPLEEGDAFYVNFHLFNDGNTDLKALNGEVLIYDKHQEVLIRELELGRLEDAILPKETKRTKAIYNKTKLKEGRYVVLVKVFKKGEEIFNKTFNQLVFKSSGENTKGASEETIKTVEKKSPKLPKIPTQVPEEKSPDSEFLLDTPDEILVEGEESDLKPSAPVTQEKDSDDRLLFLLGIGGFLVGLVALIIVVILVIYVLRMRQNKDVKPAVVPPTSNESKMVPESYVQNNPVNQPAVSQNQSMNTVSIEQNNSTEG